MRKKIMFLSLLLLGMAFTFNSCKKEEVQPAPAPAPAPTPSQSTADLMVGNFTGNFSVSYQDEPQYNFTYAASGPSLKLNDTRIRLDLTLEGASGSLTLDLGALANNVIPVSVNAMSGIFLETGLPNNMTGTYNTSTKQLSIQHQFFDEDGDLTTVNITGVIV